MITLIILILGLILGIFISYNYRTEFTGICIAFISGLFLLVHLCIWPFTSYNYEKYVVERESIVETLKYARENGNEYESAAIVKEIIEWNVSLAKLKYDNKNFFIDQYVDDRVENLDPIQ